MDQEWKRQLTPYDAELALMVESLFGTPCELKNGGDHYFFEADYEKHKDKPNYLLAVWDAIEGRAGKRLLEIRDDADRHAFFVRIKFSETQYPALVGSLESTAPKIAAGDEYCRQLVPVRAIEVTRANVDRLVAFVGGGEMEIPENGPAVFYFRNACGSVYAHAFESSYIVHVKDGLFKVVEKEEFEREYEPK